MVCNSSTFHASSARSVYIKIINLSGLISANLNNGFQTIQYEMRKKPAHIINRRKIYEGLHIVVDGLLAGYV